jgi:hypothetical protein
MGRPPEEVEAAVVAEPETAEGDSESQRGSVAQDEEFFRWKEAMQKKAAARRATLAKAAERLGRQE